MSLARYISTDLMLQPGVSNNAAVLAQNRFLMEAIGDETAKCKHDAFQSPSRRGKFFIALNNLTLDTLQSV